MAARAVSDQGRKTVAVAGAAGFVGKPLVERLRADFEVVALSRGARPSAPGLEWRRCDLLSQRQAQAALAGADLAIYLVHSMLPGDHLVQGDFADFDLLAADNFARACAKHGVAQIVYLGGLLPAGVPARRLSRHLRSRAEVERALGARGVPVTTLRAGLILGPSGSSTEILLRMARRLPVMICPQWTNTPTQPIALDDVLALLPWVLGRAETFGRTYDIGGPDVLTYRELMIAAGALLGRRPRTFSVPLITPRLSRLWISLVTGAPKALAAPLVESLSHVMTAGDRALQERANVPGRPVDTALRAAIERERYSAPRAFHGGGDGGPPVVRSVQRMLATAVAPARAAAEYPRWLAAKLRPLVAVGGDPASAWEIRFFSAAGPIALSFVLDADASAPDRVVYDITGGRLAGGKRGRFEFRSVLDGEALLCSVHDFTPRLWWPLYLLTQAQIHLLVMRGFAAHLRRAFPRMQSS
jgi:uncharacterized protein YbjT (DUF2867 family)